MNRDSKQANLPKYQRIIEESIRLKNLIKISVFKMCTCSYSEKHYVVLQFYIIRLERKYLHIMYDHQSIACFPFKSIIISIRALYVLWLSTVHFTPFLNDHKLFTFVINFKKQTIKCNIILPDRLVWQNQKINCIFPRLC